MENSKFQYPHFKNSSIFGTFGLSRCLWEERNWSSSIKEPSSGENLQLDTFTEEVQLKNKREMVIFRMRYVRILSRFGLWGPNAMNKNDIFSIKWSFRSQSPLYKPWMKKIQRVSPEKMGLNREIFKTWSFSRFSVISGVRGSKKRLWKRMLLTEVLIKNWILWLWWKMSFNVTQNVS